MGSVDGRTSRARSPGEAQAPGWGRARHGIFGQVLAGLCSVQPECEARWGIGRSNYKPGIPFLP